MKKVLTLILCIVAVNCIQAQFLDKVNKAAKKAESQLSGGSLSQDEVGKGLKEALNEGVGKAVDFLSAEDGYLKSIYKIPIPEEAQYIFDKVKNVPGFQDSEEKMITLVNRAAEDAAQKAKPIFIGAIKQMTFKDAMNILMGEKDSATRYLEKTTSQPLFAEFMPVIQNSLDAVNARSYWKSVVSAYNKIPFVKKVDPELDEYVTNKALVGMFGLIETKELDIRENQSSRSSDLLKKVFAKQDK